MREHAEIVEVLTSDGEPVCDCEVAIKFESGNFEYCWIKVGTDGNSMYNLVSKHRGEQFYRVKDVIFKAAYEALSVIMTMNE